MALDNNRIVNSASIVVIVLTSRLIVMTYGNPSNTRFIPRYAQPTGADCSYIYSKQMYACSEGAGITNVPMPCCLSQVRHLHIVNNAITRLRKQEFSRRFSSLQEIDLRNNRIDSIQRGAFQGLAMLTKLDLSGNRLRTLGTGIFKGLTSLTTLRLARNGLTHVNSGVFIGIPNLQFLRLEDNNLNILEEETFDSLVKLENIHLEGNQLSHLDSESFSGLTRLRALSLGDNQLQTIPNFLQGLPQLSEFSLKHNPILCDCAIYFLYQWLTEHSGSRDRIVCAEPRQFRGEYLTSINQWLFCPRQGHVTAVPRPLPTPSQPAYDPNYPIGRTPTVQQHHNEQGNPGTDSVFIDAAADVQPTSNPVTRLGARDAPAATVVTDSVLIETEISLSPVNPPRDSGMPNGHTPPKPTVNATIPSAGVRPDLTPSIIPIVPESGSPTNPTGRLPGHGLVPEQEPTNTDGTIIPNTNPNGPSNKPPSDPGLPTNPRNDTTNTDNYSPANTTPQSGGTIGSRVTSRDGILLIGGAGSNGPSGAESPTYPPITYGVEGQSVTLSCGDVESLPKPRVRWLLPNGDLIKSGLNSRFTVGDDVSLTIQPLQKSDAGNYRCVVRQPESSKVIMVRLKAACPCNDAAQSTGGGSTPKVPLPVPYPATPYKCSLTPLVIAIVITFQGTVVACALVFCVWYTRCHRKKSFDLNIEDAEKRDSKRRLRSSDISVLRRNSNSTISLPSRVSSSTIKYGHRSLGQCSSLTEGSTYAPSNTSSCASQLTISNYMNAYVTRKMRREHIQLPVPDYVDLDLDSRDSPETLYSSLRARDLSNRRQRIVTE